MIPAEQLEIFHDLISAVLVSDQINGDFMLCEYLYIQAVTPYHRVLYLKWI